MPPIVGLTTYGMTETHAKTDYYVSHYAIPSRYVESVRRAGGVPVLIPPGDENWKALFPALDALVITGGTDVNPKQYGGDENNPEVLVSDDPRDESELAFVRHLVQTKDTPVLCICRGMQVLNVAMGGTLHQHLPALLPDNMHRSAEGWAIHECHAEQGSQLAQIMGAETVNTYSGHHQAVDKLGDNLQVVATATDGIIEAIAMPDHPFMIGVQWHPEKSTHEDITQQRLFNALVSAVNVRV